MVDAPTPAPDANDPSGFVAACPQLAQVCHLPAIKQALRTGDAMALYSALLANVDASPVIPQVINNRRLFVSPIKKPPTMYRVNGIGTTLWTSEKGADGLAVGTLWLTVLFLPLLPLAQYLVEDAGNNSYRFFGKVPLGGVVRFWRRSFALAAVLAVVGLAGTVWLAGNFATVHLLNGLDYAVTVEVAGKTVTMGPESHQAVEVDTGPQRFLVKGEQGNALADETVDVPKYVDFVAYNVLGAAALYAEGFVYSTTPIDSQDNPVTIYVGQTLIQNGDLSYVFEEAPDEVQIPESATSVTKWQLDVLAGGLVAASMLLHEFERGEEALQLMRKISDVSPAESRAHPIAYNLLLDAGKKDDAQRLVAQLQQRFSDADAIKALASAAKDGSYIEFADDAEVGESP